MLIGASAGLLIILSRLAAAVKGGEGAPDLNETLTNLAVNTGAVALFSALVRNDLRTKAQAESKVAREEDLGKLEVVVNGRTVLLESLRLVSRPVIVFGSQARPRPVLGCVRPVPQPVQSWCGRHHCAATRSLPTSPRRRGRCRGPFAPRRRSKRSCSSVECAWCP